MKDASRRGLDGRRFALIPLLGLSAVQYDLAWVFNHDEPLCDDVLAHLQAIGVSIALSFRQQQ